MRIRDLKVENFRNHDRAVFAWSPRGNLIVGPNGAGKTSLLEAISFLALTKSFSANNDSEVLSLGKEYFEVEGTFETDDGVLSVVHVGYDARKSEKVVLINGGRVDRLSSVIGKYPVVILSPEQGSIPRGTPAERRRFVDMVISQASVSYCADLVEYRKVVRQRNRVLANGYGGLQERGDELESWNDQLVRYGSRIVARRLEFVDEFRQQLAEAYSWLVGVEEEPAFGYLPLEDMEGAGAAEEIAPLLRMQLDGKAEEEVRVGWTLVGPHRDDFQLRINGLDVRRYASHGQQKTLLVALKIAEYLYLEGVLGKKPIVLFDDVFGELDLERSRRLLGILDRMGQAFITTTDTVRLRELVEGEEDWKEIRLSDEVVRCAEAEA